MDKVMRMKMMEPDTKGPNKTQRVFSWEPTPEHRLQALNNHSQSLERLNERGGLCWQELRWILKGLRWDHDMVTEAVAKVECLELYPEAYDV